MKQTHVAIHNYSLFETFSLYMHITVLDTLPNIKLLHHESWTERTFLLSFQTKKHESYIPSLLKKLLSFLRLRNPMEFLLAG
jgi:hypothetical protein